MKNKSSLLGVLLIMVLIVSGCQANQEVTGKAEGTTIADASTTETTTTVETLADTTTTVESTTVESTTENVDKASVFPLTFTDGKGNEITLKEQPQRVVPLTGTTMYLYTLTGGTPVAGPSLSESAPRIEGAPAYDELGHMANIDVEALITHEPDFVILQSMQASFIPVLEDNGIPYMFFSGRTKDEIAQQIQLFAKFNGKPEKGDEIISSMDKKIAESLTKLPENRGIKSAIVHVSGRGISLKLPNSIAGNVAEIIGFDDISKDVMPEKMGMDSVPFDTEKLVVENPEIIFITSMVSSDENVEDVLKGHLDDGSAWTELDAVKNGKVYYLPQSHFLFNPVNRFDEAVEIMAKNVWPEAFE